MHPVELAGSRRFDWDGCLNVRDLGGLPTEDRLEVRRGLLVRADDLGRLSNGGWDGVRLLGGDVRVVDLRFASARDSGPQSGTNVEVIRVELMPEDESYWQEMDEHLRRSESATDYLGWQYLHLLRNHRSRVARAVEAVAGAPGPVVVHCRVGKDRTGVVIAVLLRLLGVSRGNVVADYAESAEGVEKLLGRWVESAPDPEERERRGFRAGAPGEAMELMLEGLDRELGGAAAYVHGAGVPDRLIHEFRKRLLLDRASVSPPE